MFTRGVLIVLCVYCVIHISKAEFRDTAGGLGEEKRGDADTQEIANKVRSSVEKDTGKLEEFTVERYVTQVVAGTNFFMKIKVGSDDYIHVKVYRDLEGDVSVSGYELNKKLDDPIKYF